MSVLKNSITYHESEKRFYRFTDSKKLSARFKESLLATMETFECAETQRSKRVYYENGDV